MAAADPHARARVRRWFLFALAAWAALAAGAGALGLFAAVPVLFTVPPTVAVGIAAPVLAYSAVAPFREYVRSVHPWDLTAFHLWRVPAGLAFLHYGAHGWLPDVFVRTAGYGDLLAGALVPVVFLLPEGRAKYVGFHLVGLADFVLAVGTGVTLNLVGDPLMANIAAFPIVLIPAFGVGVTGALHVMALDALLRRPAPAPAPAAA